ncbi:MAG: hypothetical protein OEW48_04885, partial [Phycisphaerae bacterium]|nr:hypothetical protein [Phycisphaerae bacterium]
RYYLPHIGNFTSVDPLVLTPNEKYLKTPKFAHPYAYASHGPIIYFDPDGKQLYHCGIQIRGTLMGVTGVITRGTYIRFKEEKFGETAPTHEELRKEENWVTGSYISFSAALQTSALGGDIQIVAGYSPRLEEFTGRSKFLSVGGGAGLVGGISIAWGDTPPEEAKKTLKSLKEATAGIGEPKEKSDRQFLLEKVGAMKKFFGEEATYTLSIGAGLDIFPIPVGGSFGRVTTFVTEKDVLPEPELWKQIKKASDELVKEDQELHPEIW